MKQRDESADYEIRVRGHLGETLLTAFPRLHATVGSGETTLAGVLPDQAALHGVLAQIEALGLELLEVHRMDREPRPQEHGDPYGPTPATSPGTNQLQTKRPAEDGAWSTPGKTRD